MEIQDIRIIVWTNINEKRLQIKVNNKWQDVRFVDADRLSYDNEGIAQELKQSSTPLADALIETGCL